MAPRGKVMVLILTLMVMCWGGAMAQSSCSSVILSLAPCLNYVTGRASTPTSSCCSQLASVVKSQPQCLCSLVNGGGSSIGITINQTLALALPDACHVQTPPVSQCNAVANGPTTSASPPVASPPMISPSSSSGDPSKDKPQAPTPSYKPSVQIAPSSGSGTGSKEVPSTNGAKSSDGMDVRAPIHLLVLVLSIISCASTFTGF